MILNCNRDGHLAAMEHEAGIEWVSGRRLWSGHRYGSGCRLGIEYWHCPLTASRFGSYMQQSGRRWLGCLRIQNPGPEKEVLFPQTECYDNHICTCFTLSIWKEKKNQKNMTMNTRQTDNNHPRRYLIWKDKIRYRSKHTLIVMTDQRPRCEVCLRYFYQKPACNSLYADSL